MYKVNKDNRINRVHYNTIKKVAKYCTLETIKEYLMNWTPYEFPRRHIAKTLYRAYTNKYIHVYPALYTFFEQVMSQTLKHKLDIHTYAQMTNRMNKEGSIGSINNKKTVRTIESFLHLNNDGSSDYYTVYGQHVDYLEYCFKRKHFNEAKEYIKNSYNEGKGDGMSTDTSTGMSTDKIDIIVEAASNAIKWLSNKRLSARSINAILDICKYPELVAQRTLEFAIRNNRRGLIGNFIGSKYITMCDIVNMWTELYGPATNRPFIFDYIE